MRNLNDGLRRQVGQLHTFCQFSLLSLLTSVSSQSIQPPPSLFYAFPPSTSFASSSSSNPCPSFWAFSVSCLCRPQTCRVEFRQFVQVGTCDGCIYFEAAHSKPYTPLVPVPRDIPRPPPSTSTTRRPFEKLPLSSRSSRAFPPGLGPVQVVLPGVAVGECIHSSQKPAPSIPSPRVLSPPTSPTLAPGRSIQQPPQSPRPFPRVQERFQATSSKSAPAMGTPPLKQHASFVLAPRDVL